MGGSLVIEAGNVQFTAPSDGVLCGLYSGPPSGQLLRRIQRPPEQAARPCSRPSSTARKSGRPTPPRRPRLHAAHPAALPGDAARAADLLRARRRRDRVVWRRTRDLAHGAGLRSHRPRQRLQHARDGPLRRRSRQLARAAAPSSAVDSVELTGSMGFCRSPRPARPGSSARCPAAQARRAHRQVAGEGVDCRISATGKVTFFAGRVPVAGEIVTVFYRTAIAPSRASQTPPASRPRPPAECPEPRAGWARSSNPSPAAADCESAAQAVLSFATSRAAALAGSYGPSTRSRLPPTSGPAMSSHHRQRQTLNVVVRQVTIDGNACPSCSPTASPSPTTGPRARASPSPRPSRPTPFCRKRAAPPCAAAGARQPAAADRSSATTTALQIDAGTDPPTGGGFEVRLRDWDFGPGIDQNLVLRSPVRSFSIPRAAQVERYYVRMYDASTPPLYSRLSSAVFTNLPVS
jgi:hypothetical protein